MMCRRHAPFAIGPTERDAWMLCLDSALDEVVLDEALRAGLRQAVAAMADRIRSPLAAANPCPSLFLAQKPGFFSLDQFTPGAWKPGFFDGLKYC
jgi:hypothetical protein